MHATTGNASWWVWSCWRTRGNDSTFLYGCAAKAKRAVGRSKAAEAPLTDRGLRLTKQKTLSGADFDAFISGAANGELDLGLLFGAGAPSVPVRTQRDSLRSALGDTATRARAYCSMPGADIAFGASGADLEAVLGHLTAELGLPVGEEYVGHLGNFEVFTLVPWAEKQAPFLIEGERVAQSGRELRGPRSLLIARTPAFAAEPHFAHVVIRESGEVLEDRLVELPAGICRSDPIQASDVIDSFDFSLFDRDGRLLHRQSSNFIREVGMVMEIGGGGVVLNDALTARAAGVSPALAQAASVIRPRHSQRIHVAGDDGPFAFRRYQREMRAFVRRHRPPASDDRFFRQSVADEVGAIQHLNSLLGGGRVSRAILVDPYFGASALSQIALRLSSRDVTLTVVTSWTKVNPDTGSTLEANADKTAELASALAELHPFIGIQLRLVNLADGNEPAFHDRYLLLYPHEGEPKVYLLSNSLNRIAGKWPFCMSVLADDIRPEVQAYIEGLAEGKDLTGCTSPEITYSWPTAP
jgi:hypothetical protein